MRRTRVAAAIVLVACGLLTAVISSAGTPTPASAAGTTSSTSTTSPTAPSATTGSASNLGQSSATLSGTVNPDGQATTYYFEYGTSSSYGTQTGPTSVGSGTTPVGVHADVFGLTQSTPYHYRLVAQSSAGITNGADQTLTTPTTTPSQTVVLGHEGFVSPGWIVGAEVGCFHGTTTCTGQLTMSHQGTVIAQRAYSIPADSGGFQNMELNAAGRQALKSNSVFNLIGVTVTTAPTGGGQPTQWTIHLARWVWN
jgi:hypothetical protein